MLKMKHLSFTNLARDYCGLCVFIDNKKVAEGFFTDVLTTLSNMEEKNNIPYYEVVSTREYFDMFIIELKSN